ncbi:ferrochelatase [Aliikangiella sp. IMCC44653]
MKYKTHADQFSHSQKNKIGVLITNLGTPEAPTKGALRRYLKEFLSDPRVVEIPRLIWWFILNLVILNIRPKRSAKAYQTIWSERGSPLMFHTEAQAKALQKSLDSATEQPIQVEFAMRYGQPSVSNQIDKMMANGVTKLLVVPLYPQYSGSTSGSTFDAIASDFTQRRVIPDFRFVSHYHDYPPYIEALANKIVSFRRQHGESEKLIFSYHGIPKRYLTNGDPYHCECYKTSRLVAEKLGLNSDQYITTFQSRFGKEEWLKPYTDHSLAALAKSGVKSVQVVCPGFSADCLETIEEIAIENRDVFLNEGGQSFEYIEALNSDQEHINALSQLVLSNITGWTIDQDIAVRAAESKKYGATQ